MTDIVETIVGDLRDKLPFRRLVAEVGTDMARAYALQEAVTARLVADHPGRRIAGWKLGFNKQASYDYYGISEPCAAPIFSDRIVDSPSTQAFSLYRDLVIEPEIAAFVATDLPDTGSVTGSDARAAIGALGAAFELLDPRGAFALDPGAAEAVAQGIHNVGAVLGPIRLPYDAIELDTLPVALSIDRETIGEAVGAAPQRAEDAVAWLANHLAARGQRLEAGMVVLCGTHLPAQAIATPGTVVMEMGALGAVRLTLNA